LRATPAEKAGGGIQLPLGAGKKIRSKGMKGNFVAPRPRRRGIVHEGRTRKGVNKVLLTVGKGDGGGRGRVVFVCPWDCNFDWTRSRGEKGKRPRRFEVCG